MGGAVSSGENNDALVDNLIRADYMKCPEIERVFRAVDRAFYYTDEDKQTAYKDLAWKNKNLHLSAPCIYSQVMESLELKEGMSFLNLGSGTGYLSTMVGLIIGSRGVNHGLEIHQEVIDYAHEKLQAFIKGNPAIDEYDFCIPQFEQGNCLSLAATDRRYDRIYCGAACPEVYNNYIKQLVDIGGILVMPVNDELLQIRRTDENSWSVNRVLPVSFSSLILPQQEFVEDTVLPPINPHSLQNLCRIRIRSVLRQKVSAEHPDLWLRSRKQPKETKRPVMRRCVVPLFANTDSDSDSQIDVEPPEAAEMSSNDSSEHNSIPPNNEEISMDRRAGVRSAESLSDSEDAGAKTKREKFDSGVSDVLESGSERSSSSCNQSPAGESSARPSSVSERNSSISNGAMAVSTERENVTTMSEETERQVRTQGTRPGIRLITHSLRAEERERAALLIFESHMDAEETSGSDGDEGAVSDTNESPDCSLVTPPEDYSYYMKRSLMEIPLPFKLKSFLNYDRAF
ncbi:hypothetical protein GHT06_017747 [Daphnia sinensis]|uniref:Protein-L-isoaspartate O-methyltransferase domain-containing protein 1 n=1 Tax=Daphnia sinensis TaxID=1820382 RepID=A0AAD5KMQ4_9CRUS|nr:hypothetical protein GHT06_017747 [Daphnia sinensis]